MNTTKIGNKAEAKVAEHMVNQRYTILARNWKTKTCEVDLIATRNEIVYFVEVKFRSSSMQGRGYEYVTLAKLRQMEYAAKLWIAVNRWQGQFRLCVAGVQHDGSIDWYEVI